MGEIVHFRLVTGTDASERRFDVWFDDLHAARLVPRMLRSLWRYES